MSADRDAEQDDGGSSTVTQSDNGSRDSQASPSSSTPSVVGGPWAGPRRPRPCARVTPRQRHPSSTPVNQARLKQMRQQLQLLESAVLTYDKPSYQPPPSKPPVLTFEEPLKRSTPEGLTEAERAYYDGLIAEDYFKFLAWPEYDNMSVHVPTEPPTLQHLA